MNRISRVTLNRQLNRDTANAMIEARNSVISTVGITMIAELVSAVEKPPWLHAVE